MTTYFDQIVKKYAMYTEIQINQSQHALFILIVNL